LGRDACGSLSRVALACTRGGKHMGGNVEKTRKSIKGLTKGRLTLRKKRKGVR